MKLYDCQGAPNPRRVRIFLSEKGIEIPSVDVSIVDGDNLKPEYLAVNPRGMLPTLELDDGTRIDEVPAICTLLEAEHPEPPLLGTTAVERALVLSWDRHMELDGMNAVGEYFRNSAPLFADRVVVGRAGDAQIPALAERGRRSIDVFFDRLEARLAESEYVAGPRYSLADITALCAIDLAGFASVPLPDDRPQIRRWYDVVNARPGVCA